MPENKPEIWYRFAGKDSETGELREFNTDERYPRAFGYRAIVRTQLTEDSEGTYFGWIETDHSEPEMIQPHWPLYSMQFPYTPEAEERAGRGRTVKLSVNEI